MVQYFIDRPIAVFSADWPSFSTHKQKNTKFKLQKEICRKSCHIFHLNMYSIRDRGAGSSHETPLNVGALVGTEEPSMRDEWLDKIGDVKYVCSIKN